MTRDMCDDGWWKSTTYLSWWFQHVVKTTLLPCIVCTEHFKLCACATTTAAHWKLASNESNVSRLDYMNWMAIEEFHFKWYSAWSGDPVVVVQSAEWGGGRRGFLQWLPAGHTLIHTHYTHSDTAASGDSPGISSPAGPGCPSSLERQPRPGSFQWRCSPLPLKTQWHMIRWWAPTPPHWLR